MGKIVGKDQPCIAPDCDSSDAMQVYEDGGAKCFSCGKSFGKKQVEEGSGESFETSVPKSPSSLSIGQPKITVDTVKGYTSRGCKDWNITKSIFEFYGVKVGYNNSGNISTHFYPYGIDEDRQYKVRVLPKEKFYSIGDNIGGLFGRELFSGGGKRLVINEGEKDTLTVAQISFERYKKHYPIVGLRSSTSTEDLLKDREWIRSFQEVVLMFDNDEAGDHAREEAIRIIGMDKVKITSFKENDAHDLYINEGSHAVLQAIWDAGQYKPAGIIGKEELWEALCIYNEIESIPYPPCLDGINMKIKGMRMGEIALFISGTGSGKSTMMREVGLHILDNSEDKIGIISLEESPAETSRKFAGMAISRNPALEEIELDDLKVGFDKVFGDDKVILLDHQGSIKDASIIDQLEYMCLMGCKYLFIDHITILVSEGANDLTGNEAIDKIMNDLLRLVKRHNVWIGLVSHLRKAPNGTKSFEEGKLPSVDDIRGSGSIKQVSFDIIAFARDMTSENEETRNTIMMSVLKSRTIGKTGPVPGAKYNETTGRLKKIEPHQEDGFEKTATETVKEVVSAPVDEKIPEVEEF